MKLFSKFLFKLFSFLYPCKIYGYENMIKDGCVVTCNHFRFVDSLFIYKICGKDGNILCKKEVFKTKLVAGIVKDFNAIPITREKPQINELLNCINVLKSNKKLIIFPEGTRNKTKDNNLQKIKSGAGFFAIKSRKPVVPVMIYKRSRMFKKTYILIGKPFYLSEFYDAKLDKATSDKIDGIIYNEMVKTHNELKSIVENNRKW